MLKPIKNEAQYENALERAYLLMQMVIQPETQESDELEILSILIKEYEQKYYPVPKPNPLEAIKSRLTQLNITDSEFSKILGSRSRKSEILSGKRKLNLSMIRKLSEQLHIPTDILIQEY